MLDIYTIIFPVTTLMSLVIVEKIMGIFYEKRKTSFPIMIQSFVVVFILFTLEHLFFLQHPALNRIMIEVLVALAGYFIITLNYESSYIKRLVVSVLTYLLFVTFTVLATTVLFIFMPLYSYSIEYEETLHFMILLNIVVLPLAYLVTTLIRRFKHIRKNKVFTPVALVVPILTMLIYIGFFFMPFALILDLNIPREIGVTIFGISMMGAVMLMFYLYDSFSAKYQEKLHSELHSKEKEYYFTQCQLMQESIDKVKSIRHDIKLHMTTLKEYAVDNKEATDYLNHLLGDIEKSEIYSETGNIAFDSIINFKLRNAKENNINVDISVAVPPALNIDVVDVVTILGNLLDNALEAVAAAEEKSVKLDVEFSKGSLYINIENTFDGTLKYIESNDGAEKTIATRKVAGEHGHGLKNVRKSVEKYNGHIDIAHENNVFSVGILIYSEST